MTRRIFESIWFLIGLAITRLLIGALQAVSHIQSGMSAGAIPAPSVAENLIPWLAYSYFILSAAVIWVGRKRSVIWMTIVGVHLTLLAAFALICWEGHHQDWAIFLRGVLMVGLAMTLYFSPWVLVWCARLLEFKSPSK